MADGVWKGVYPLNCWRSRQLSLKKFFDLSTPSIRKGRNGEWKKSRPPESRLTGMPTACVIVIAHSRNSLYFDKFSIFKKLLQCMGQLPIKS